MEEKKLIKALELALKDPNTQSIWIHRDSIASATEMLNSERKEWLLNITSETPFKESEIA
jgi:hypothetical protein